jgi:hypothetical protein
VCVAATTLPGGLRNIRIRLARIGMWSVYGMLFLACTWCAVDALLHGTAAGGGGPPAAPESIPGQCLAVAAVAVSTAMVRGHPGGHGCRLQLGGACAVVACGLLVAIQPTCRVRPGRRSGCIHTAAAELASIALLVALRSLVVAFTQGSERHAMALREPPDAAVLRPRNFAACLAGPLALWTGAVAIRISVDCRLVAHSGVPFTTPTLALVAPYVVTKGTMVVVRAGLAMRLQSRVHRSAPWLD